VTTWYKESDEVVVTWVEPDNGGYAIHGYTVTFRQNDLVYSQQLSSCDMTSSILVTCTIHVTIFRSLPYDLPWG
jgi:hypothetical protein